MLLISGGDVVTMNTRREVLTGGSVAIVGDRIAAVGSTSTLRAAHPGAAELDATGCIVTPGLVNAHQHHTGDPLVRSCIPDLLAPGESIFSWSVPLHAEHTGDDDELSAALTAAQSALCGVTTLVEAGTVAHPDRVAAGMAGRRGAWHRGHLGLGRRRTPRSRHRPTRCSTASAPCWRTIPPEVSSRAG